jgi:hypothetical protein
MTTLALPRPTGHGRRLRVLELATGAIAGLRDGLRISRRYHALNSLSDAELARRGLTRGDLARAAVQAVG